MTALSQAQAFVVNHGTTFQPSWEPIESPSPVHRSDLPSWLLGMEIDWMWDYDNWPHIRLFTTKDAPFWEPKLYTYIPERRVYASYAPDGYRASFHYHGPCTWQNVDKFIGYQKTPDGKNDWNRPIYIAEKLLCTAQSQGYGGSGFNIRLKTAEHPEGEPALLRGPWHGVPLPGWQDVAFQYRRGGGGTFGTYVSDELLIKALAYYLPHLRMAHGYYYAGQNHSILTPYVDGQAPKNFPGGPSRRTFLLPYKRSTSK